MKRIFSLTLCALILFTALSSITAFAAVSKVQYYKTVAPVYDGDAIKGSHGQHLGISGVLELNTAGIDKNDKKVGTGSFFQKALAASSNPLTIWICGDDKWDGKGMLDISSATRPGFAMWYYVKDKTKMEKQSDGAFLRVRFGSSANDSLSRNDDEFVSLWIDETQIQDGWNYVIVEIDKAKVAACENYTSEVDGFTCTVSFGSKKVNLALLDWFILEVWPGGALTYKLDYLQFVDLSVKQNAPSAPTMSNLDDGATPPPTTSTAVKPNESTAASPSESTAVQPAESTGAEPSVSVPAEQGESEVQNEQSQVSEQNDDENNVQGSNTLVIVLIAIIVVLIAAGALGYFFLVYKKK